MVTIHSKSGALEYKDKDSDMVGHLNVYWGWDDSDQVWTYNSDDGRIYRWKKVGKWTKTLAKPEDSEKIPQWILPEYARTR